MKARYLKNIVSSSIWFLLATFLTSCSNLKSTSNEDEKNFSTFLIGVSHIGIKHTISEFYVDGYSGGTLGEARTASAWNCCVALPRKPKTSVIAKIRWQVIDWSQTSKEKIWSDYKNAVYLGPYHADVPVEYAEESGFLFVHFFSNGMVRAVISNYPINHPLHPVSFEDNDGGEVATVGVRIKKIFPLGSAVLAE